MFLPRVLRLAPCFGVAAFTVLYIGLVVAFRKAAGVWYDDDIGLSSLSRRRTLGSALLYFRERRSKTMFALRYTSLRKSSRSASHAWASGGFVDRKLIC